MVQHIPQGLPSIKTGLFHMSIGSHFAKNEVLTMVRTEIAKNISNEVV